MPRVVNDRPAIAINSLVEFAQVMQGEAKGVMRLGVIRLQRQPFRVSGAGFAKGASHLAPDGLREELRRGRRRL